MRTGQARQEARAEISPSSHLLLPSPPELQSLLFEALAQPIGLLLRTNSPARARDAIYAQARAREELRGKLLVKVVDHAEGEVAIFKPHPTQGASQ